MTNPYGTCYCTHYIGGPPCIHSAYERGVTDTQEKFEDRVSAFADDFWGLISAIVAPSPQGEVHEARQVSEDVFLCVTCKTPWPCLAIQRSDSA